MNKAYLLIVVAAFVLTGRYILLGQNSELSEPTVENNKPIQTSNPAIKKPAPQPSSLEASQDFWIVRARTDLQSALQALDFNLAIEVFNQAYDRASSSEIELLSAQILSFAAQQAGDGKPELVIQLLDHYLATHTDLDGWRMLTTALAETQQWAVLLEALTSSNRLETDGERYQGNLRAMVRAASQLSTEFERNNDRVAILDLYQALYEEYPQYPRFQLDLARAHLALGAIDQATPLLRALIYDPNFGSLASQQLELIAQENESERLRMSRLAERDSLEAGQIVVPLIRAGTSLLVDTQIEGVSSRLLLDTGASLTALSVAQIEGLGLEPTGQSVRLNTANGTTTSRLFKVRSLAISGLVFQNIIVAEIDLADGQINGLLGTDVLRQLGDQYSYLIDDRNNALIFRPR